MDSKIKVSNLGKVYQMYNTPMDRLKESLSLTKKIRHIDFHALKNISFEVEEGEILGIIGRNGAGKSTLLKLITGVLTASSGTIEVKGRISSLLELGTGFNMEYTGMENIYFYATLMGLNKKEIEEKIPEIISFAEIGDYIDQPVKTYSSGMFARLAFSCAINVNPDILIVDEILSVGDMRFQSKCFNKFKEFKEKGVTILYVGHDVGVMKSFCDTVLWINNGEIIDIGDPSYICAKYTEFMYLEDISEFTTYKKEPKEEIVERKFEDRYSDSSLIDKDSKFQNCLAHWGTNIGIVEKVDLYVDGENEKGYFYSKDEVNIDVYLNLPKDMDLEFFSIAFSIKNEKGTDLIVKSTYDENIEIKRIRKITFKLKTLLATGEYYLVVALENRKNASISYYEYIEGIKYFKVYSNKKIFGVVDLETKIEMR